MVKIASSPNFKIENNLVVPLMTRHDLKCTKSAPTFKEGKNYSCYIALMSDKRYAVFTASGVSATSYHVFNSKDEVNEHFEEN